MWSSIKDLKRVQIWGRHQILWRIFDFEFQIPLVQSFHILRVSNPDFQVWNYLFIGSFFTPSRQEERWEKRGKHKNGLEKFSNPRKRGEKSGKGGVREATKERKVEKNRKRVKKNQKKPSENSLSSGVRVLVAGKLLDVGAPVLLPNKSPWNTGAWLCWS